MGESKWLGRLVWRELTTDDFAKSKGFYGELFGWTFEEMPMGPGETYTIVKANGSGIGGLMKPQMKGQPNAWLGYVSVPDADAALEAVKKHGGQVFAGPIDIPQVGRFGIFADFAGAVTAVMRTASEDQPIPERPPLHTFCWETVTTTDVDKAIAFYAAVAGWGTKTMPGAGVKVFTAKDGAEVADVQKASGEVPPMWLTYVVVEKLEATRDRVGKLGGKVLEPLIEVPNVGRIAVVAGPEGAPIGIFQPKM